MRHMASLLGAVMLLSCKSQEEQILAHYRARMDRIEKENAAKEAARPLPGGAVVPATPQPAPPATEEMERAEPGDLEPVIPPTREDESTDRTLQRAIQAALGENPRLGRQLQQVEVSVYDGKVVLMGEVRSRALLLRLEKRVAEVPGVENVENLVAVKGKGRK